MRHQSSGTSSLIVIKRTRPALRRPWQEPAALLTPQFVMVRPQLYRKTPEPALTTAPGKSRIAEGQHKFGDTKDKAGKAIMSKIDEVDLKIENEASKAKGGISSWFGGK